MHADVSELAEAQPRPAGSPERPTTKVKSTALTQTLGQL